MSRLRAAVIGAGWWSTVAHLPSLAADRRVDLVAVCDPSRERIEAARNVFDIPYGVENVDELLSRYDVDIVVVATPNALHHRVAVQCLRAGAHVLIEKPIAITAADAWNLVRVGHETKRILSIGYTYQFAPTAQVVKSVVSQDIGKLVCVNAEFSSGFARLLDSTDPSNDSPMPGEPHNSTYADPALSGGGQAQTQLTHVLGALLWAADTQAITVSAEMDQREFDVDVVDALAFRLQQGAIATAISAGTTAPGVASRHELRFHGTKGMVEWDLLRARATAHTSGGQRIIEPHPHLAPYPRDKVASDFVSFVCGEQENLAPAHHAAASASLIEAAYAAASTGKRTPVMQGVLR